MRSTEQALLAFATVELVKKAGWMDDYMQSGTTPQSPAEYVKLMTDAAARQLRGSPINSGEKMTALLSGLAGGGVGAAGGALLTSRRDGETDEALNKRRGWNALKAGLGLGGVAGATALAIPLNKTLQLARTMNAINRADAALPQERINALNAFTQRLGEKNWFQRALDVPSDLLELGRVLRSDSRPYAPKNPQEAINMAIAARAAENSMR